MTRYPLEGDSLLVDIAEGIATITLNRPKSLEAARCVAEGIVSVKDAAVGSLLGRGFPAALGGAISHIDTVGTKRFVAECDRMAKAYGQRFEVPAALREKALRDERYHA